MIALIDHGVGNLRSVEKALTSVGADVQLTNNPESILAADKVVLPGVGAFADSMNGLRKRRLVEVVKTVAANGTSLLGICVGMQMLFDFSEEHGRHNGLSILPGSVKKFEPNGLKIPQTGWNEIIPQSSSPLLKGLPPNSYAYFNHSYFCIPSASSDAIGCTDYGGFYVSVVGRDRIYGVQFHPEKSQNVGLKILRNFVEKC